MGSSDAFRQAVVERLRDLIRSRGVTVAGIERDLGRSRGYLADAMRGDKRLTLDTIADVLEYLGVSPQAFFAAAPRASSPWPSRPGDEIAEGVADTAYDGAWECPCRRLHRRFEELLKALEEAGAIDPQTAAKLREL